MKHCLPLSELCVINMGQSPDSSSYNTEKRGLPFFQGNADFGKISPHVRIWCDAPTKIAHAGDLLFSVRAPIGALNIAHTDCCIGRGLAAMSCIKRKCDQRWLFFALQSKVAELQSKGTGSTFKAISKKTLFDTLLPDYSVPEQQKIADHLAGLSRLISMREEQMEKLTQLASSRFVEMFGDPIKNPKDWQRQPISSFAKVKIGPFGSSLHAEDYVVGGYPLVNPSHLHDGEIIVDSSLTLSKEKYEELTAYHLLPGDIVIGRRGEIGRCAMVKQKGLFCGTGSLFVRIENGCRPDFLQRVISYPSYKAMLEDKAVGVTMKNLNAGTIENSLIPLPPLTLQNEFAAFIEQLDKSKFTIRQSLEKLNLAYKAQLQEYFG